MNLTKCDNHPDRDAVVTFRIIKLATVGLKPLWLSANMGHTVDLCEECENNLKLICSY